MSPLPHIFFFFFFNDTATTEIYTLSLHDALPIWICGRADFIQLMVHFGAGRNDDGFPELPAHRNGREETNEERSEEHTSELQSLRHLVCRLLLEKKKKKR